MVEMMAETGEEIEPELSELVSGIDFTEEKFGMKLLQKSLKSSKTLHLWWD